MFFALLTFATALFIEGLGSLVSVIGISALFGANPIIIALAVALDVGKLVCVSLLFNQWGNLPRLMKGYALVATFVTMVITSAGAAGYLTGSFQQAILGTQEGALKVQVLKEQQAKFQARKKQIDDQVAALPERTTVSNRLRLIRGFQAEQQALDAKIASIDTELPKLQISQLGTEAKAGPILYVAKAFDVSVESAVKWVVLLIVFVFDPLAVFLIIAGNFLWAQRKLEVKRDKWMAQDQAPIVQPPVIEPEPMPQPSPEVPEVVREPDPAPIPEPTPPPQTPARLVPVFNSDVVAFEPARRDLEPKPNLLSPVTTEPEPSREEITRSTLGLVKDDPSTIVDAQRTSGFRQAGTKKT